MKILSREDFTDDVPGESQSEKAEFLNMTQGSFSRWSRGAPKNDMEIYLLRAWRVLSVDQKEAILWGRMDEENDDD